METKVCKCCGNEYALTYENFGKDLSTKDGYTRKCKKCLREYALKYYYDNHDKMKKIHRENYKNYAFKNKEKVAEKNAKYLSSHLEEHREYNRKYSKEHRSEMNKNQLKWLKTDKGKEVERRRQEKRRNIMRLNKITDEQIQECKRFFENKCAYTGIELTNDDFTFDHITALSRRGINCIWNIVPCDKKINAMKGNTSINTWYNKQEFYSEERMKKIQEWIEYSKSKYMVESVSE